MKAFLKGFAMVAVSVLVTTMINIYGDIAVAFCLGFALSGVLYIFIHYIDFLIKTRAEDKGNLRKKESHV